MYVLSASLFSLFCVLSPAFCVPVCMYARTCMYAVCMCAACMCESDRRVAGAGRGAVCGGGDVHAHLHVHVLAAAGARAARGTLPPLAGVRAAAAGARHRELAGVLALLLAHRPVPVLGRNPLEVAGSHFGADSGPQGASRAVR